MLKSLHVKNFTVFENAKFDFGPGLNVIVGANGTGKSHVLKLGYGVEVLAYNSKRDQDRPYKDKLREENWQFGVERMLEDLFLVEPLRKLIRQQSKTKKAIINVEFGAVSSESDTLIFNIIKSKTENDSSLKRFPSLIEEKQASSVLLPAKEVLSFHKGFSSILRKYELSFDKGFLFLLDNLALPPLRTPPAIIKEVLEPAMQGRIALEGEEFVFYPLHGEKLEINMVAEGIRKLGMLSVLLANGSLTPDTTLFWDEPEANLNPQLIKKLAEILVLLARQKFQIVLATHSLFLMKEIHILSQQDKTPIQYFSLHRESIDGPVEVEGATSLPLLPHIVALQAEMEQADEFLDALNHADADV